MTSGGAGPLRVVRAFVLHWDAATLPAVEAAVRAAGADVVGREVADGQAAHDAIRKLAPDVVVAWLAWKPAHTRVTLAAVRSAAWGRRLPLLLVDDPAFPASPALLRQMKEALPGAIVDVPSRLPFWVAKLAALPAAPPPSP